MMAHKAQADRRRFREYQSTKQPELQNEVRDMNKSIPSQQQSQSTTSQSKQLSTPLNPYQIQLDHCNGASTTALPVISQGLLSATQQLMDEINSNNAFAMSTPNAQEALTSGKKRICPNESEESIDEEFEKLGIKLGLKELGEADQTPGIRNISRMVAYLVKIVSFVSTKLDGVSRDLEKVKYMARELTVENKKLKEPMFS